MRSRPIEGRGLLKKLSHADPELLPALCRRSLAAVGDSGARSALNRQFSLVLDDLCIASTWKRTMPGRLPETVRALCQLLAQNRAAGRISWLDLGASDGITTLDMKRALSASTGATIDTCLADRYLKLRRFRTGPLIEYRTTGGLPVLARIGRLGIRLPRSPRRWDIPSNLIARLYLSAGWLRQRLAMAGEISLVNPALNDESEIEIIEMDVLVHRPELRGRFDAIRISNVLNHDTFTDTQMLRAVANLHTYLCEDGVLIVSRNFIGPGEEAERGGAWRKRGKRFEPVANFGGGFERKVLLEEHDFSPSGLMDMAACADWPD